MGTALLLELYRRMLTVRRLEERLLELKKEGRTVGALHLCVGQEAVGIGVGAALRPTDTLGSTHRGHAHLIGKGTDLRALTAELWGKAAGVVGGRGGHQLMADPSIGLLGGSGVVGSNVPVMVGQALAMKMRGEDRVAVALFGDGAANIGEVHEAINLASVWRLPVIFVCENNQWGLTVPFRQQCAVADVAERAKGYGVAGGVVDGNDVEAVYGAVTEGRRLAVEDGTPSLLEMKTYRLHGFSTGDLGGYQPEDELELWRARDPLLLTRQRLAERQALDDDADQRCKEETARAVEDALEYAMSLPDPDPRPYVEGVLR